jgi:hypothetical protein
MWSDDVTDARDTVSFTGRLRGGHSITYTILQHNNFVQVVKHLTPQIIEKEPHICISA